MSGANHDSKTSLNNSVSFSLTKSLPRTLAALVRYPEARLILFYEPETDKIEIRAKVNHLMRRFEVAPTTLEAYSFDAIDHLSEKMICQVVQDAMVAKEEHTK